MPRRTICKTPHCMRTAGEGELYCNPCLEARKSFDPAERWFLPLADALQLSRGPDLFAYEEPRATPFQLFRELRDAYWAFEQARQFLAYFKSVEYAEEFRAQVRPPLDKLREWCERHDSNWRAYDGREREDAYQEYRDVLDAAGYAEDWLRQLVWMMQSDANPVQLTSPPPRRSTHDFVTMDEAATLVMKSKKTLQNVASKHPAPHPVKTGIWRYSQLRPWLLKHWPDSAYRLPEDFKTAAELLRDAKSP